MHFSHGVTQWYHKICFFDNAECFRMPINPCTCDVVYGALQWPISCRIPNVNLPFHSILYIFMICRYATIYTRDILGVSGFLHILTVLILLPHTVTQQHSDPEVSSHCIYGQYMHGIQNYIHNLGIEIVLFGFMKHRTKHRLNTYISIRGDKL